MKINTTSLEAVHPTRGLSFNMKQLRFQVSVEGVSAIPVIAKCGFLFIAKILSTRGQKLGASQDTMIYLCDLKNIEDGPNMLSKLLDIIVYYIVIVYIIMNKRLNIH